MAIKEGMVKKLCVWHVCVMWKSRRVL